MVSGIPAELERFLEDNRLENARRRAEHDARERARVAAAPPVHPSASRYACCHRAVQIPCVCAFAFTCPEHGDRHVGSHD